MDNLISDAELKGYVDDSVCDGIRIASRTAREFTDAMLMGQLPQTDGMSVLHLLATFLDGMADQLAPRIGKIDG